ncbi:uncharacterized protein LOC126905252 isoform X3 [Daktulosphaira vitifoliae]|uniref:uncharacterized protein LOC126905252 isoform X3 n=1 Tax=Daktulosphaira vitifoliae TaxID=58002 RepID=UPI0021AB0133|nr:uncharacterized protein LOC126905252 isoform X3 [Daktulosphaira vitifoliae]
MDVLTLVFFLILMKVTIGLKIIDVLVPRFVDLKDSVTLECHFVVGHGKLYSVKWYKDDNEFYRFVPEDIPSVQVFHQSGIALDLTKCNMRKVTLKNLTLQTSGIYKCEVSTDAPKFEIEFKSANMSVISYPEGNPLIEGIRNQYAVGELVSGNCSSYKSYPQPSLTWYINGNQIEKKHFQGPNVELDLTCEATFVQYQLKWRKIIVIQHLTQSYTDNMLQEGYRNRGFRNKLLPILKIFIITLILNT